MTMTYDILAIIGVNKVGVSLPPPSFYFSLRTGSLEEDSGGRGKGEGGRRGGGGSGNWVSFFWILDGSKVRIRYTGSGVGMNGLALFPKA